SQSRAGLSSRSARLAARIEFGGPHYVLQGVRAACSRRRAFYSSRTGVSADISFDHHGVPLLGELNASAGARFTIFRVRLTNRPLARPAKSHQYRCHRHIPNGDSRNRPRRGDQYENNQNQVHPFLLPAGTSTRAPRESSGWESGSLMRGRGLLTIVTETGV